jgi:hypothetical protein
MLATESDDSNDTCTYNPTCPCQCCHAEFMKAKNNYMKKWEQEKIDLEECMKKCTCRAESKTDECNRNCHLIQCYIAHIRNKPTAYYFSKY